MLCATAYGSGKVVFRCLFRFYTRVTVDWSGLPVRWRAPVEIAPQSVTRSLPRTRDRRCSRCQRRQLPRVAHGESRQGRRRAGGAQRCRGSHPACAAHDFEQNSACRKPWPWEASPASCQRWPAADRKPAGQGAPRSAVGRTQCPSAKSPSMHAMSSSAVAAPCSALQACGSATLRNAVVPSGGAVAPAILRSRRRAETSNKTVLRSLARKHVRSAPPDQRL